MSITKEEIIIELSFPNYKKAYNSRFINLFEILTQKDTIILNYNNQYKIHIENIQNGTDRRSSLIIKNLPKFMTKGKLVKLLIDVGNINFLYIPYHFVTNECLGYAYINMINYKNVINVYQKLNGLYLSIDSNEAPLEVLYSQFQGKIELCQIFGGKKD